MLTLTPGSSCDVCADEYGPHCLPHSIPCGHVLCASCCNNIAQKTSRASPACPFCRETFNTDAVRLIRMDFNTSGWTTPRRVPDIAAPAPDLMTDAWLKRLMQPDGSSRSRQDARKLEAKVAKVAGKRCSVEEVTALHNELQDWLMNETKPEDDISALTLSAALLRAILMNHVAHSDASRNSKMVEATMKARLDELEAANNRLDAELKRQRAAYNQKIQECQGLRQELARLKVVPSTPSSPPMPTSVMPEPNRHRSPSPPPVRSPYSSPPPTMPRYGTHMRTSSISSASQYATRPTTPSPAHQRSQTPGPLSSASAAAARAQTPAARSQTPGPNMLARASSVRMEVSPTRSATPAPNLASSIPRPMSRAGATTPTQTRHTSLSARSKTPAPVAPMQMAPQRQRRMSQPVPPPVIVPSITRSISDEKHDAQMFALWKPNTRPNSPDEIKKFHHSSSRSPSRNGPAMHGFRLSVEDDY
ncbi:unnamed protein product [Mycena citricolor]|uniref:RING-type domain-containing protein n=1 Tax=Mycena citricolor TaxID=2018698 RepID=A0AAD2GR72_9AGAR|nr:unnamed protein product [Mycena citricolor]CAK5274178.1 unnamed protein product [Mycena citricolor]